MTQTSTQIENRSEKIDHILIGFHLR